MHAAHIVFYLICFRLLSSYEAIVDHVEINYIYISANFFTFGVYAFNVMNINDIVTIISTVHV